MRADGGCTRLGISFRSAVRATTCRATKKVVSLQRKRPRGSLVQPVVANVRKVKLSTSFFEESEQQVPQVDILRYKKRAASAALF